MVTIGHFGERFRGRQYTLVSFLFAPRCPPCPAICKSGARPRALWFRTHCLRHGPSVMVWGQVVWDKEVPQFGRGAKPWYGIWCPPFPAICKKNGSTFPRALWSRRHCTL